MTNFEMGTFSGLEAREVNSAAWAREMGPLGRQPLVIGCRGRRAELPPGKKWGGGLEEESGARLQYICRSSVRLPCAPSSAGL